MKKFLSCFIVAAIFLLSSCSSSNANSSVFESTATTESAVSHSQPHTDFSFNVKNFDTVIHTGETITICAELKNNSSEDLMLYHDVYLIRFWIQEKNEASNFSITFPALLVTTEIIAGGSITKEVNFKFEEAGTYYLYGNYSFSLDEKFGSRYFDKISPIEITVI